MSTITLTVSDMHCAACSNKIANRLANYPGVTALRFNPVRKQVLVTHDDGLEPDQVIADIEVLGFSPVLSSMSSSDRSASQSLLLRLGVAGLALMQVMMAQGALYAGLLQGMEEGVARLLEYTALLFSIPVVCYSAAPFLRRGFGELARGVNMDTPIALAISTAFAVSVVATLTGDGDTYYDSVVMFTFLMLGARYFDARLRSRLSPTNGVLAALPQHATRLASAARGQATQSAAQRIGREQVAAASLQIGDRVWVGEGEQLPADGVLLDQRCVIDESLLSGESGWREYHQQALLFAGTYNRGAGFQMEVTAPADSSRLADIEQIATDALAHKHQLAKLADRVATWFIPAILLISLATYIAWMFIDNERALTAMLCVLVVSCPCALSLATPAALAAAMARLRQLGVLVKTTRALEEAGRVSHLIFDKTGTLASPTLGIRSVRNLSDHSTRWCTEAASALQRHSSHPLSSAFGVQSELVAENVDARVGAGLSGVVAGRQVRIGSAEFCRMEAYASEGSGKHVYLCVDEQPAAVFELVELPREDAADTVAALLSRGLTLELLSGDLTSSCRRIAAPLRLPFRSRQRPEQKFERMRFLREQASEDGHGLMYVGDGMNDIPALAAAHLSVATLETNDLVKSRSDAMLLTRRLSALVDLLEVGERSQRVVHQNLYWALGYNLIAIPLAAVGGLPPWAAALGMSLSSIIVLLNSSRLLRVTSVAPKSSGSDSPVASSSVYSVS